MWVKSAPGKNTEGTEISDVRRLRGWRRIGAGSWRASAPDRRHREGHIRFVGVCCQRPMWARGGLKPWWKEATEGSRAVRRLELGLTRSRAGSNADDPYGAFSINAMGGAAGPPGRGPGVVLAGQVAPSFNEDAAHAAPGPHWSSGQELCATHLQNLRKKTKILCPCSG